MVKLQTEHHLEFLNCKGGCTGSSESTIVKTPPCLFEIIWHAAHMLLVLKRDCAKTYVKTDEQVNNHNFLLFFFFFFFFLLILLQLSM